MAMLAEPRRKQKVINLRAKNSAWSNDSTKFGQRMLEKMGWTSGKGLGANENGITEHVVARYKNDDKGLGFEDKNDQWTQHEDDFNALLANLSNASDKTENLHSGISLEDKSKKSKARIHYHKFTRGKDISRYSEKDLANIFGKKSLKNIEVVQESLKEDIKSTEQVFTEKGSMEDYFKNKLTAFKSKSKCNISNVTENNSDQDETNYNFCGFSQEIDVKELCGGLEYNEEYKSSNESINVNNTTDSSEKLKKKKKHSKIERSNNNSNNTEHESHENQSHKCSEEIIMKKKKSKNKTYSDDKEENSLNHSNGHEISLHNVSHEGNILKKKKKSNKNVHDYSQNTEVNNFITIDEQELDQIYLNKKKEQSKNVKQCEDNVSPDEFLKKKKSKRKKEQNVEDKVNDDIDTNIPKKKKKKKCKENL